jgi:hypothetical protein
VAAAGPTKARAHESTRAFNSNSHPAPSPCLAPVCKPESLAIGVARVGQGGQTIIAGTLAQLAQADFGPPLHSLVLVGPSMHEMEQAMFDHFRWREGMPRYVKPRAAGDSSDSDDDGNGAAASGGAGK